MLRKAVLISSLVLLLVCVRCDSEGAGESMVKLQKQDDGGSFIIEVGSVVFIELEETGATGYLWLLDALDQRLFDLVRVDSRTREANGKLGAPIMKVWELRAKHKGKTSLGFSYCRPWEGKEVSLDRFMVEITIQ